MPTQTQTSEQTCTVCGMPQDEWKGNGGRGVQEDGKSYCCKGCASGGECSCED